MKVLTDLFPESTLTVLVHGDLLSVSSHGLSWLPGSGQMVGWERERGKGLSFSYKDTNLRDPRTKKELKAASIPVAGQFKTGKDLSRVASI